MNVKITDLPSSTALTGAELFETVQSGVSAKATANQIKTLVGGGVKVYRALLTQSGTDAPVATVLENTLGSNVTFTYDDQGAYIAQNSLFTSGKTTYFWNFSSGGLGLRLQSDGSVGINSIDDNQLIDASIEILVYP